MDRNEINNVIEKLSKFSILLVDDDVELLKTVERIYKRYFKEVHLATDGTDGIEKYKIHNPDIVISDVSMPRRNGIEMAEELFTINKNIKIVFVTGHNEVEYLEKFKKFGGLTITKPVNTDTLLEMAMSIL